MVRHKCVSQHTYNNSHSAAAFHIFNTHGFFTLLSYLRWIDGCNDPHTVCIAVILDWVVRGCDDARRSPKMSVTHSCCRVKSENLLDRVTVNYVILC